MWCRYDYCDYGYSQWRSVQIVINHPHAPIWHLLRPICPRMMYNDHALRCAPPNGHPTDHFQRIFGQVLWTIQRFGWPGRRQGAPSTSQPGPNPPGGVAMGEGRGSFAPDTPRCPPAVPARPRRTCPFGAGEPDSKLSDRAGHLDACPFGHPAWAQIWRQQKAPSYLIRLKLSLSNCRFTKTRCRCTCFSQGMRSSRAVEPCENKPNSVLVIHGRSLVGHFDKYG